MQSQGSNELVEHHGKLRTAFHVNLENPNASGAELRRLLKATLKVPRTLSTLEAAHVHVHLPTYLVLVDLLTSTLITASVL